MFENVHGEDQIKRARWKPTLFEVVVSLLAVSLTTAPTYH